MPGDERVAAAYMAVAMVNAKKFDDETSREADMKRAYRKCLQIVRNADAKIAGNKSKDQTGVVLEDAD